MEIIDWLFFSHFVGRTAKCGWPSIILISWSWSRFAAQLVFPGALQRNSCRTGDAAVSSLLIQVLKGSWRCSIKESSLIWVLYFSTVTARWALPLIPESSSDSLRWIWRDESRSVCLYLFKLVLQTSFTSNPVLGLNEQKRRFFFCWKLAVFFCLTGGSFFVWNAWMPLPFSCRHCLCFHVVFTCVIKGPFFLLDF